MDPDTLLGPRAPARVSECRDRRRGEGIDEIIKKGEARASHARYAQFLLQLVSKITFICKLGAYTRRGGAPSLKASDFFYYYIVVHIIHARYKGIPIIQHTHTHTTIHENMNMNMIERASKNTRQANTHTMNLE